VTAVLGVAVKVIAAGCVVWTAACAWFVAKWLLEAAWDRRHQAAADADDEIDMVTGPTDEQLERFMRTYNERGGDA